MNVGDVERVAFRFSRGELAALLQLMGAPELPGMDLRAAMPEAAVEALLVESGIVTPCGARTFVDRTIAAVLNNALRARRMLRAESPEGRAALYAAEQMCVLVATKDADLVSLEPFPDGAAAKAAFMAALDALGPGAKLFLTAEGAERAGGARALYERFEKGGV